MNTGTQASNQIVGRDVFDSAGTKVGTVARVWTDESTNLLEFIGVKTGWLFGSIAVVPADAVDTSGVAITVPYPEATIKDGPTAGSDDALTPTQENAVYAHYGMERTDASVTGLGEGPPSSNSEPPA